MQSLRFRGDFPSPTRWPTDPSNLQKAPVWVWQRLWQAAVRSICSSVPCHSGSLQRVANREEMCPNHLPKHSPSLFLQIFAPIQSSAPPAPPPSPRRNFKRKADSTVRFETQFPPGPGTCPPPSMSGGGPPAAALRGHQRPAVGPSVWDGSGWGGGLQIFAGEPSRTYSEGWSDDPHTIPIRTRLARTFGTLFLRIPADPVLRP